MMVDYYKSKMEIEKAHGEYLQMVRQGKRNAAAKSPNDNDNSQDPLEGTDEEHQLLKSQGKNGSIGED